MCRRRRSVIENQVKSSATTRRAFCRRKNPPVPQSWGCAVAVQVAVMNGSRSRPWCRPADSGKIPELSPLPTKHSNWSVKSAYCRGFRHSAAVLHVQPAFPGHGEYAGQIGESLPAWPGPAVQQALHAERLELDVAEFDLAGVELEADVAAAERGGVGVVEHDLAAKLDDKMAPLGGHVEGLPVAAAVLAIDGLPLDEAAGWKRVCARVRDVQLIAAGFHVGWDRRRPQENAAIGSKAKSTNWKSPTGWS